MARRMAGTRANLNDIRLMFARIELSPLPQRSGRVEAHGQAPGAPQARAAPHRHISPRKRGQQTSQRFAASWRTY
jgi:hypothetical protein